MSQEPPPPTAPNIDPAVPGGGTIDVRQAGSWFLGDGGDLGAAAIAVAAAVEQAARRPAPSTALSPAELATAVAALDPLPDDGVGFDAALAEVAAGVLAHGVHPWHPHAVAHLHAPTVWPAAAAELAIGATNQSLDSYDQAPAATLVEDALVRRLAALLGLPAAASGVMTAGGTASNLLGLTLARGRAAPDAADHGLPAEARSWRILTSAVAHDSVRRAAAILGLGARAIVPVAVDARGAMDIAALDEALAILLADDLRPLAIVATAGTTDLGAIDPLEAIAGRARDHGAWLHVDAAVASAFALSDTLRPRLDGIGRADSVTVDLHKLWWQPIGASALLVADEAAFAALDHDSDYLNRAEDRATGTLNLVARSLDTSRRFDALKLLLSGRTIGRRELGAMVERLVALADGAAAAVRARPALELVAEPSSVMVVFALAEAFAGEDPADRDARAIDVQRELFASGEAVLGRTRVNGRVVLKLTLINPRTRPGDIEQLLDRVVAAAVTARSGWPDK
ncbi:pyridoxal-dependent decarboxylase [Paraconexibacter sp. AEG42_29]|uniref:pyridoxal phosphate-dependent decarboxylase family protein n=1 Tax=Paraconexibacter sp. AEG42_29 TaxID=2997339 RepID=UPI00339D6E98